MRAIRFLLALTSLFVGSVSTRAREIVVAPSGAEFSRIQSALNVAVAGDTIIVRQGTYNEKLTFPRSGDPLGGYITLRADTGAVPVLSGTNVSGQNMVTIANRSYVKLVGFEIRDHTGVRDGSGVRITGSGSHIEIRDNRIHEIRGTDAMGITVYGTSSSTSLSQIIIDGNEVFDCEPAQSEALTLNGNVEQFQVTNNVVRDVNNIGIDFIGGESGFPAAPLVTRNGIVRGNRVLRARSNYEGGFGAGIYVDGGRDILIENNVVTESDLGIEIGAENPGLIASGVVVRNNILFKNDKAGLVMGGYDVSRGRTRFCSFLNNTLYKNDVLREGLGQIWIQFAEDNTIENNIIWAAANGVLLYSETGNINNNLNYNIWFFESGPNAVELTWNNTTYSSFGAYRTATKQDVDSLFVNPLFVAAEAGDFHIAAGSPAAERANPNYVPGPGVVDIDGEPRLMGYRVDVGVDELPVASTTTSTSTSTTTTTNQSTTTTTSPGATTTTSSTVATTTTTLFVAAARRFFPQVRVAGAAGNSSAGFAVINLSGGSARLSFQGFTDSGLPAGSAVRQLEAHTQLAELLSELFPAAHRSTTWVVLESDQDLVEGFFLLFDDRLTFMDGTVAPHRPMNDFVWAFGEGADISLTNPSDTGSPYEVNYIDATGTVQGTLRGSVPPWGRISFNSNIIRPVGSSGGYLKGTGSGLVPLAVLGNPTWLGSLPASDPGMIDDASPTHVAYAPQYAEGGGFITAMDIVNLESRPIAMTLRLFGDDGAQIGSTGTLPIPPGGSGRVDHPSFFGLSRVSSLVQGYVRAESTGRFVGSILFTDTDRLRFGSALSFVQEGLTTTFFSQVAQDDLYYTGLAAVNLNTLPTTATITVYDTTGAMMARASREIPSGGRFSELLFQLVGPFPPVTKGYFSVVSSLPVASFAIFGTHQGDLLAAIPPQTPTRSPLTRR